MDAIFWTLCAIKWLSGSQNTSDWIKKTLLKWEWVLSVSNLGRKWIYLLKLLTNNTLLAKLHYFKRIKLINHYSGRQSLKLYGTTTTYNFPFWCCHISITCCFKLYNLNSKLWVMHNDLYRCMSWNCGNALACN